MTFGHQLVLNTSTIIDPAGDVPLEDELAAAAAAGWTHVELRGPRIVNRPDLPEMLDLNGLTAFSINAVELARGEDAFVQAEEFAAAAALIGAPYVLCVSGLVREGTEEQVRAVKEIVAGHGVRTAFEFIGFERFAVRDLPSALEVARAAGVEVVIDFHHWFGGGNRLEDLLTLRPGELAVVHVNDLPAGDVSTFTDADRQLPGEGARPITKVFAAIAATGYDGPVSVETFHPEHWARGPHVAAALAAEATGRWVRGL